MGICFSISDEKEVLSQEALIARNMLPEVRKLLLHQQLDPNNGNAVFSPLLIAVWYGHLKMVHLLLTNGGDVNLQNKHTGDSCLHYAVMKRNADLVLSLLHMGAKPNIQNHNASTPLHIAAEEEMGMFNVVF